jgi:hypothetical protein
LEFTENPVNEITVSSPQADEIAHFRRGIASTLRSSGNSCARADSDTELLVLHRG